MHSVLAFGLVSEDDRRQSIGSFELAGQDSLEARRVLTVSMRIDGAQPDWLGIDSFCHQAIQHDPLAARSVRYDGRGPQNRSAHGDVALQLVTTAIEEAGMAEDRAD